MSQIEVQIMGQSYLLGVPPDGESSLRSAVERVDSAMCKIRDAGKMKARDRIAVLASLNLAFDLVRCEAELAAAPAAQAVATNTDGDAKAQDEADQAADDARATQLIQRLDQALAGDGHLL